MSPGFELKNATENFLPSLIHIQIVNQIPTECLKTGTTSISNAGQ